MVRVSYYRLCLCPPECTSSGACESSSLTLVTSGAGRHCPSRAVPLLVCRRRWRHLASDHSVSRRRAAPPSAPLASSKPTAKRRVHQKVKPFQRHDIATWCARTRGTQAPLAKALTTRGGRAHTNAHTDRQQSLLAPAERVRSGEARSGGDRRGRGEKSGTLLTRLVYLECGGGRHPVVGGGGRRRSRLRCRRLPTPAGPLRGELTADRGGSVPSCTGEGGNDGRQRGVSTQLYR